MAIGQRETNKGKTESISFMTTLQAHLLDLGACSEARRFAEGKTAEKAWLTCTRPDWLLWWAARTDKNDPRAIVKCAAIAARKVLHLIPPGENRPRLAIEAAEACADSPAAKNKRAAWAARAAAWAARSAVWAASAAEWAGTEWAASAAEWASRAAAMVKDSDFNKALCADIRRELSLPWKEGK